MAKTITIYRTRTCVYCAMATRLAEKRGFAFKEVYLDAKPEVRAALQAKTGWSTVPMIYVGERFVGGYTDLATLDRSGELARLMAEG